MDPIALETMILVVVVGLGSWLIFAMWWRQGG